MRLKTKENDEAMQLTPLIDVVFLLLIFFLTATTFSKEEVEMNLELPKAASGKEGQNRPLVINVAKDGELMVDGRPVNTDALLQKLRAAAARDRKQQVLIRGDIEARYGIVAKVLDACRVADLRSISMGATPVGGR